MARSKRSDGSAGGGGEAQAPSDPGSSATLSFEAALAELEGVVSKLESGDMPLEQALEAFEAGVRFSRRCASTLDAAERRIEILMTERAGGASRTKPFGAPASEDVDYDEDDEDPDAQAHGR